MIRTALITALAVSAMVVGAAGVWFHGAGTARAPEPARLTAALSGGNGATATAVPVSDPFTSTTVVKWPGSWLYNPTLRAGQPCSTIDLASGEDAVRFIVATGNYRKCM